MQRIVVSDFEVEPTFIRCLQNQLSKEGEVNVHCNSPLKYCLLQIIKGVKYRQVMGVKNEGK